MIAARSGKRSGTRRLESATDPAELRVVSSQAHDYFVKSTLSLGRSLPATTHSGSRRGRRRPRRCRRGSNTSGSTRSLQFTDELGGGPGGGPYCTDVVVVVVELVGAAGIGGSIETVGSAGATSRVNQPATSKRRSMSLLPRPVLAGGTRQATGANTAIRRLTETALGERPP